MWTRDEKERHINELELMAALLTLKTFCRDMRRVHVLIKIDNTTAVNYINNKGGRKEGCNEIARQIWVW